jgi:hypothetical protein
MRHKTYDHVMTNTAGDTRMSLLLEQYDTSRDAFAKRLEGLSDVEFHCAPRSETWDIRLRADASTSLATGKGEWVLDFTLPEPDPPPWTTIAWRLGHLQMMDTLRHHLLRAGWSKAALTARSGSSLTRPSEFV